MDLPVCFLIRIFLYSGMKDLVEEKSAWIVSCASCTICLRRVFSRCLHSTLWWQWPRFVGDPSHKRNHTDSVRFPGRDPNGNADIVTKRNLGPATYPCANLKQCSFLSFLNRRNCITQNLFPVCLTRNRDVQDARAPGIVTGCATWFSCIGVAGTGTLFL